MALPGLFGKMVRVRANGLLVENGGLLMVRLESPVTGGMIWMPPGGGVRFGEPLIHALEREMKEETGIDVAPGPLWYLHEVIHPEVHAIEFYYLCKKKGGALRTGSDPEYPEEEQIIRDAAFLPVERLDREDVHPVYVRRGFARDHRNYLAGESMTLPKII